MASCRSALLNNQFSLKFGISVTRSKAKKFAKCFYTSRNLFSSAIEQRNDILAKIERDGKKFVEKFSSICPG